MTQDLLPPSSGSCPAPDDAVERGARAITLPILAVVAGMLGSIALLIGLVARLEPARERPLPTVLVERGGRGAELPALTYSPMATAITPITSLTASRPTELGGSTSGSLYASADRIDIYARTSSSTATLNLVEYLPDDGKWVKHGADCAVTTDLTLCRYVAKRGARYWHVYKASGSMAYVGIEQAYNQGASLGSIEPTGSSISLPLGVADGGTGLTSYTAGDLLYATGSTTLAKLGIGTEGYVLKVTSGVPAWGAASGGLGTGQTLVEGTTRVDTSGTVAILTVPLPANGRYWIEQISVGAIEGGAGSTDRASVKRTYSVGRTSGTATAYSVVQELYDQGGTLGGATWSAAVSGTNLLLRVAQGTSTATNWYTVAVVTFRAL